MKRSRGLAMFFILAACDGGGDTGEGVGARELEEAREHLTSFGYLPNTELSEGHPLWVSPVSDPVAGDPFEAALRRYQRNFGLPEDGTLNAETMALMKEPRCGFPDNVANEHIHEAGADGRTPRSHFTGITGWSFRNLSGSFNNYAPTAAQRNAVYEAASQWDVYSGITLAEVPAGQGNIGIWLTSGAPCSPGALACAYYPPGTGCSVGSQCGDVYFLSQLPWNTNGAAYDIATVMLHELGHSLGLPHSFNSASVMFPYYQGVRRTLSSFDIDAIRHLYGP